MPRTRKPYPPEFREQMVALVRAPEHRHGAGRILPPEALKRELEKLSAFVNHNLAKLPDHNDFIKEYCPAQN